MSAYAVSFTSCLPQLISPKSIIEPNSSNSTHQTFAAGENDSLTNSHHENELSQKRALRISIKSANIDARALISSSKSKKRSASPKGSLDSSLVDAIRFQMSINFNGRKYTATRPYSKFVKLRRDLIKELSKTQSRKHRSFGGNLSELTNTCKADLLLPELPDSLPMTSGMSVAKASASVPFAIGGCGFTMLQSLLVCYYCPLMERWLKQVTDIIDADMSSAFNSFVWEPLRDDSSIPSISSSCTSSLTTIRSLSSIHEDLDNCDE